MLCGIRPLLSKQSQLWKMLKHILREIGRAILPRTQKITMKSHYEKQNEDSLKIKIEIL